MNVHSPPTILMYHDVRDFCCTAFPRRYEGTSFLTPAEFEQQLDYVERHYDVMALADLERHLREGESTAPAAVLTFDDGLADHFDQVRPILLARGLPATFFIPTAPVFENAMIPSNKIQFVLAAQSSMREVVEETFREIDALRDEFPETLSRESLWERFSVSLWANNTWTAEEVFMTRLLRDGLEPADLRTRILDALFARFVTSDEAAFAREFYMTPEQTATLHRDGFGIGGHGHLSVPLTSLTANELSGDLQRNVRMLRSAIPALDESGYLVMSYPNGAVNDAVVAAAAAAGFTIGLTTEACKLSPAHTPLQWPRVNAPAYLPPKVHTS